MGSATAPLEFQKKNINKNIANAVNNMENCFIFCSFAAIWVPFLIIYLLSFL
jgi:hypothetical protein